MRVMLFRFGAVVLLAAAIALHAALPRFEFEASGNRITRFDRWTGQVCVTWLARAEGWICGSTARRVLRMAPAEADPLADYTPGWRERQP